MAANSFSQTGILLSMKTNTQLSAFLISAALMLGPGAGWSQQPDSHRDNGAKQDMRDAGHESKDAAKDTGHGVKQGTKHAYHSTKRGTRKAWNKTKNTSKGAVNGGREGAKQPPQ
jgi:Ni/Co efflux regulator RcnB